MSEQNSKFCAEITVNGKDYRYFSINKAGQHYAADFQRLPFSLKVLLENLLRNLDGSTVTDQDIEAIAQWSKDRSSTNEIAYRPARVLMQDFTGVPAVVDLAAMRAAMVELGGDPEKINPLIPVDLVIDHSVQVDTFADEAALAKNIALEMERNRERYQFLRWGQQAFHDFRVVPPGTGICHQVNLEYLAKVVWQKETAQGTVLYPDTLVGTDSHTTMVNGLGVLGWGVGGIEAEAAMLGQPISMVIPEVVGVKLTGQLQEGTTATDLVLRVTEILRKFGVVGKFVEFFGPGLTHLPLADRATIANMAPEYGATCGFFPVDEETIKYLHLSGRDQETIDIATAYCQAQGLWRNQQDQEPLFSHTVELDLSSIEPSLAGPKRPQDRVPVKNLKQRFQQILDEEGRTQKTITSSEGFELKDGAVVIAAITSCTNTSNPSVLIAAGLVAKKAVERGLSRKPWVKSSFAPGSKVVTEYLDKAGLQTYLDLLGFNLVGYGCTTCIGNSGPLPESIANAITQGELTVSAVLSGNRHFEGRVHPLTKANWLASPPLVVAYALAGTTHIDLVTEPLGNDQNGNPVYLKDIWPSNQEIADQVIAVVNNKMFSKGYADVFKGDSNWQQMSVTAGKTYQWDEKSTYARLPSFFEDMTSQPAPITDIKDARILALLGDSITTDHISPAGAIKPDSPAGSYLQAHHVAIKDFNSYGSRRGNHEVMVRGTFANIRIRNEMLAGIEGGFTKFIPENKIMPIFDAAMAYKAQKTPLVVIAGKEYGTGSSRDWAAKGTLLLGVRAVIAESYERIHRSNLIGMGILPLEFTNGQTRKTLNLTGTELVTISGLAETVAPRSTLVATLRRENGCSEEIQVKCRIDTENELHYFENGGILHYVLRNLAN